MKRFLFIVIPFLSLIFINCSGTRISSKTNYASGNTDLRTQILGKWEGRALKDYGNDKEGETIAYVTFKQDGKASVEYSAKYDSKKSETNYKFTDSKTIDFFSDDKSDVSSYHVIGMDSENIVFKTAEPFFTSLRIWDYCKFRKIDF
jgi:hypothetical protein